MDKKLLVTTSEHVGRLHGVRFVGSFFENKRSAQVTLFYVAPISDDRRVITADRYRLDPSVVRGYEKKGREALDLAKGVLLEYEFPQENIECRFAFKECGTVRDITREAHRGRYDAIVLGRRGYTVFENVLSDSVTRQALDEKIACPLWICKPVEKTMRNVLLCVDGSMDSLKAADHVGFMLEAEEGHSVTVLHVDTGTTTNVDYLLEEPVEMLVQNNIPTQRIHTKVVRSHRVAQTILEQARSGGYAAVAVGRVGVDKSRLKEWVLGSRTVKLLKTLEAGALWVTA